MLLLVGPNHIFRNWGKGRQRRYLESLNLRKEKNSVSFLYHGP